VAKKTEKLVHCRYAQCAKLHETTELKKEDAVKSGSSSIRYYHHDCYHIMTTIVKIRNLFIDNINPIMTGQQISILVHTIENMVFDKKIDVDYILFALEYYIEHKTDKLKHPHGMYYIVQDFDVSDAWNKEQERKLSEKIAREFKKIIYDDEDFQLDLPESDLSNKTTNKSKFSSILGV